MEKDTTQLMDAPGLTQGLTYDEDNELRRLHYFSQFGTLVGQKLERFLELRMRDRRKEIRPPREFIAAEQRPEELKAGWRVLIGRRQR